jgi:hypothetical protein
MGTASATSSTAQHHQTDILLYAIHHGHPETKQRTHTLKTPQFSDARYIKFVN